MTVEELVARVLEHRDARPPLHPAQAFVDLFVWLIAPERTPGFPSYPPVWDAVAREVATRSAEEREAFFSGLQADLDAHRARREVWPVPVGAEVAGKRSHTGDLADPLLPLWLRLTTCDLACCGVDGVPFDGARLAEATRALGPSDVLARVARLQRWLANETPAVVVDDGLEAEFDRATYEEMLRRVEVAARSGD